MMISQFARSAVAVGVAAMWVGGFAAAPAFATTAAPTTVQLQVVDSTTGQPVADINVFAANGHGSAVEFGVTDREGHLTLPAGGYDDSDTLTAGTWAFGFDDTSDSRPFSEYAPTERDDVTITAGSNDLGAQNVDPGGVLSGTARTPSGHLLGAVNYDVEPVRDDGYNYYSYGGATEEDGTFEVSGLATGTYLRTYDASASGYSPDGTDAARPAPSITITEPGQHVIADLVVRIDATPAATTLRASSPAKSTARLVFKIANTHYGITDPHGVVTIMSAAGKRIGDPIAVTEVNGHGQISTTFPATSTTHTYRAYYSSGEGNTADLRSISRTTKLRVR